MLRVFIRNRFLFKLSAKMLVFLQDLLMFSFKPVVFLLETLELFPELDKPFFQNSCTPMLRDELVEEIKRVYGESPCSAKDRRKRGNKKPDMESLPSGESQGAARDQAGKAAGVSGKSVDHGTANGAATS
ncbi:MAG: hypothetical protein HQ582_10520 [Planctomycetes bacterium]|nr:hypothetical protein [Planctomycetota bacterium]